MQAHTGRCGLLESTETEGEMDVDVQSQRHVAELIDLLEVAAVGTAESALQNDGSQVPPTVHLISSLAESPYMGYLMSRPFTRGADAAAAIAGMGRLPAVMRTQELVVTWEHADVATALESCGAPFPMAVAVLVASHDHHEVRWHPFEVRIGPTAPSGLPSLIPSWSPVRRQTDGTLPEPIARLLAVWRAGRDPRELRWLYGQLESEGYTVHWMKKAGTRATAAQ